MAPPLMRSLFRPFARDPLGGLQPPLRTLGPGSVSTVLKVGLDVAYLIIGVIFAVLLLSLVAALFIPLDNLTVTVDSGAGARQLPLERPLLLFGVGSAASYFGAFLLILRHLRSIFRTLAAGDPFQPENVRRLRAVGVILAVVTGGVAAFQGLVSQAAPEVMDPVAFSDLLTPLFSVLVVFVLAEVFREGARLRRESELTI